MRIRNVCMLQILALLLVVSFAILGCGDKPTKNSSQEVLYRVRDYQGTEVVFTAKPRKIITQSLGYDTMLLGVVEPERLIAANYDDSFPEISSIVKETEKICPKIKYHSAEEVLKLDPDLIIASTWSKPEMIKTCREYGMKVVVCKGPTTIKEVYDSIRLIAAAVGETARGEKVIKQMEKQLTEVDAVLDRMEKKRPCGLLISMMTNYGGPGSMFDSLLTRARIENGIARVGLKNGDYLAKELVVKANPDFFLLSQPWSVDIIGYEAYKNHFLQDDALKGLRALNNLVMIEDRYIYSASQQCVYAIKALANAAYGNIFDMSEEKLIKGY